jgi:hypothetical protein
VRRSQRVLANVIVQAGEHHRRIARPRSAREAKLEEVVRQIANAAPRLSLAGGMRADVALRVLRHWRGVGQCG